jgi:hypothetical protein
MASGPPRVLPLPPTLPLHAAPEEEARLAAHPCEASAFGLPEAIRLGLGDFIFYRRGAAHGVAGCPPAMLPAGRPSAIRLPGACHCWPAGGTDLL